MAKESTTRSATARKPKTDAEKAAAKAEKAKKFVELCDKRMTNTLKRIRQLIPLGKYPHNDAQSKAVIDALKAAVSEVETAFTNPGQKRLEGFSVLDAAEKVAAS